ncbi:MAG: bacillithiol biosynthesis cysteine-adding enzyme BshC [Acidobacteriota bacterium]|nr:bacillithiol biosynthesis cysteine-adding enzyme BshC [Blastocatellia bacterium]MDW8413687.1 bacillithiol biosynthesis cysteine-adding enzyme BshC [Acidobacteriota bacterium]
MNIDLRNLPGFSRLLLDYIYNFDTVASFYDHGLAASEAEIARNLSLRFPPRIRSAVKNILLRQNEVLGASAVTIANIELLGESDAFAVVTGQQAGLFTGPLYTIYKAITAIKVAQQLTLSQLRAVPVFWVASDDHDWAEVNHCFVIDTQGNLQKVVYQDCELRGYPVGGRILTAAAEDAVKCLFTCLPDSEHIAFFAEELMECYRPGRGFVEAFSRLLLRMFPGLIVLDPQDRMLKQLSADVFAKVLNNSEEISRRLFEQTRQLLLAGYEAQVRVEEASLPIFVHEDGKRFKLRLSGRGFVSASGREYEKDELLARLAERPEDFSPSALFRPILQDSLLPTLVYIAGPAEIAYFAQLRAVYDYFGLTMPKLVLRGGATLLPERSLKLLERYGLSVMDLLDDERVLQASNVADEGSLELLRVTEQDLVARFILLRNLEPALLRAIASTEQKVLNQLQVLREKILAEHSRSERSTLGKLARLKALLWPAGELQERRLNIYYFLSRWGRSFIDRLYEALDSGAHKLVEL